MSTLEDLYRGVILDHYRNPRNRGDLPTPPAQRVEVVNTSCGDEVVLYTQFRPDGQLADIRVAGHACSVTTASASLMAHTIEGRSMAFIKETIASFESMLSVAPEHLEAAPVEEPTDRPNTATERSGDLDALQVVARFPNRRKCVVLPWDALSKSIDAAGLA